MKTINRPSIKRMHHGHTPPILPPVFPLLPPIPFILPIPIPIQTTKTVIVKPKSNESNQLHDDTKE